jgi:hypothetical protein
MGDLGPTTRTIGDVSSIGLLIGTILGYLPAIAAGFSIIYYCILIYKSQVFQKWLKRRRLRRSLARRAARQRLDQQPVPN